MFDRKPEQPALLLIITIKAGWGDRTMYWPWSLFFFLLFGQNTVRCRLFGLTKTRFWLCGLGKWQQSLRFERFSLSIINRNWIWISQYFMQVFDLKREHYVQYTIRVAQPCQSGCLKDGQTWKSNMRASTFSFVARIISAQSQTASSNDNCRRFQSLLGFLGASHLPKTSPKFSTLMIGTIPYCTTFLF